MAAANRLNDLRIDRAEPEAVGSGSRPVLWILASLLFVLAVGLGWFYLRSQVPAVRVVPAALVSADARRSATVLDASGYVTARLRATVSSKITGKIIEVRIEEGMAVDQGQILARLDNATPARELALVEAQLQAARSNVAETEVRLAEAELHLRRTRSLVQGSVTSQDALDAAQATVDALKARLAVVRDEIVVVERQVALRQQDLEDTVIRAPFAGVVVTKDAQPGEMISPVSAGGGFTRTGIGTLVDMNSLEIEVDVNEAYINRVKPGQKVEATLDAYPDWKIPATVITSVPTADRQRATVQVRIAFAQLDPRILPDMGVKVSFLEDASTESMASASSTVVGVPAAAVRQDGGQDVVFVVVGDRLERRAVRLAGKPGERAEIAAGLNPGDSVVVEGPDNLQDGIRVRVQ